MKKGVMDEIFLLQKRRLELNKVKQLAQCSTASSKRDGFRIEYYASNLSFSPVPDVLIAISRFFLKLRVEINIPWKIF